MQDCEDKTFLEKKTEKIRRRWMVVTVERTAGQSRKGEENGFGNNKGTADSGTSEKHPQHLQICTYQGRLTFTMVSLGVFQISV